MTEETGGPERVDFHAFVEDIMARAPTPEECARANETLEQRSREGRLHDSGIVGSITPEDLAAIVRDELVSTQPLRAVQRWIHTRSTGLRAFTTLVLVGERGLGKTVAGGWLLARLGGFYATAETLRHAFDQRFARERGPFQRALDTRCLVIDELGDEKDRETGDGMLYAIVNKRMGHSKAWTLITGNLSKFAMAERYDPRTVERIEHRGVIFPVEGPNLRVRVEQELMRRRADQEPRR